MVIQPPTRESCFDSYAGYFDRDEPPRHKERLRKRSASYKVEKQKGTFSKGASMVKNTPLGKTTRAKMFRRPKPTWGPMTFTLFSENGVAAVRVRVIRRGTENRALRNDCLTFEGSGDTVPTRLIIILMLILFLRFFFHVLQACLEWAGNMVFLGNRDECVGTVLALLLMKHRAPALCSLRTSISLFSQVTEGIGSRACPFLVPFCFSLTR